jgi:hypothetical protein
MRFWRDSKKMYGARAIRLDLALAGCDLIVKCCVDVAPDVQAGHLVRVLPEWRSEAVALMPSRSCAASDSGGVLAHNLIKRVSGSEEGSAGG